MLELSRDSLSESNYHEESEEEESCALAHNCVFENEKYNGPSSEPSSHPRSDTRNLVIFVYSGNPSKEIN